MEPIEPVKPVVKKEKKVTIIDTILRVVMWPFKKVQSLIYA